MNPESSAAGCGAVDVTALRELLAQATPGPWSVEVRGGTDYTDEAWSTVEVSFDGGESSMGVKPGLMLGEHEAAEIDAALIVAAVNALPALLDRLEASISREIYDETCRLAGEENRRLREERDALAARLAAEEKRHNRFRSVLSTLHVWTNDDANGTRFVTADDLVAALEADADRAALASPAADQPNANAVSRPPISTESDEQGQSAATPASHAHTRRPLVGLSSDAVEDDEVPVTPWRVGRHYGIHVYEGDRPVATFLTVFDARLAVEAFNSTRAVAAPVPLEAQREDER